MGGVCTCFDRIYDNVISNSLILKRLGNFTGFFIFETRLKCCTEIVQFSCIYLSYPSVYQTDNTQFKTYPDMSEDILKISSENSCFINV